MNNLVFDLIKTATLNAQAKDPAHAVPEYQYIYSKELIDLVVNDCISVIECLSPGYRDYRDQIEEAFRVDCIEEIKQRFGVKECTN
jgi:hypothetical protein